VAEHHDRQHDDQDGKHHPEPRREGSTVGTYPRISAYPTILTLGKIARNYGR
jgi:hypothetical protein